MSTAAPADSDTIVYKTKIVEFLGRRTPIILQNENGPCPLLAICNVLLLRNNLDLGPDPHEVPLPKLLSQLASTLIDSNSNHQGMDDGYVSNQQQNITDAMNLLHCLATGIDVNVQFTKINDFEFTRECAIFDLLDIGLYHGWIVDPQDTDTAAAIGSKSYNTLVAELVDFETRKAERESNCSRDGDSVDFAAATTATLGVPSPNLSRGRSFDDGPVSVTVEQLRGKGDIEEETELMRALNMSKVEISSAMNESTSSTLNCRDSSISEEITEAKTGSVFPAELPVAQNREDPEKAHEINLSETQENSASVVCDEVGSHPEVSPPENDSRSAAGTAPSVGPDELIFSYSLENGRTKALWDEMVNDQSTEIGGSNGYDTCNGHMIYAGEDQSLMQTYAEGLIRSPVQCEPVDRLIDNHLTGFPGLTAPDLNIPALSERKDTPEISEVATSSNASNEPIYEGEEHILDSGHSLFVDREPVYEGEVVLAEQADKEDPIVHLKHDSHQRCNLVKTFLDNNASQLTIYGLFCLQEGLKERELCVFFRNNHFSTMFKFNGELYLLATDQGYISQPDLVWEKLNEINGDNVFMTGNLKEFKADGQVNDSWNEQSAMTNTADYLAILEGSSPPGSDLNSDLQLAIALQQQEFEQQPERHQQQSQQPSVSSQQQQNQQPSVTGRSQLVTGPQRPRSSSSTPKSESKVKDKCILM